MKRFHDDLFVPKTTVLHYKYSSTPYTDTSVIKLYCEADYSPVYVPEKDYFLFMGSTDWKIVAKFVCDDFTGNIELRLPHTRLTCHLNVHNGYVSNARTPNSNWSEHKNRFIVQSEGGKIEQDFDIWLTFEPMGGNNFNDIDDDWNTEF